MSELRFELLYDEVDFLLDDDMFTFVDFQVKENYITDKLLHDTETVYHQFDNEVGIPSNPQEKKERMVTNEIESCCDCRNSCFIRLRVLYLDILNS